MTTPSPPSRVPLPVLRAAVFAVVGAVLGVSAHHVAAEGPLPWRQGGFAALALFGVGLAGGRRPRSLTAVVAACGAAQAGLHLWLTATHPHGTPHPGHLHHVDGTPAAWHGRLHDSATLTMTALHLAAAVLVAVLLHRADAVCWALARGLTAAVDAARARIAALRAVLPGGRRPTAPGPRPSAPALPRPERQPSGGAVLADVVVRRGPPGTGHVLAAH
ncbi:hypothetical protein ACWD25_22260 [Streptomyces sp. NPDC002920]